MSEAKFLHVVWAPYVVHYLDLPLGYWEAFLGTCCGGCYKDHELFVQEAWGTCPNLESQHIEYGDALRDRVRSHIPGF